MTDKYDAEWARGVINNGMGKAQSFMDNPELIDSLLNQLQEKLEGLPEAMLGAFKNVPLMVQMVKSYINKEYTDVSPKVIVSLISAFLYLVKKNDIIPDYIPVIGLADDLAVIGLVMIINEPELKAYAAWHEQKPKY